MIKWLEEIFSFIFKVDKFLNEGKLFKIKGIMLILILLLPIRFIGICVQNYFGSDLIIKLNMFFVGIFIYLLIPYINVRKCEVKKYIFFGKKQEFNIIIQSFSLKSYLIFVGYLSYFFIFPIVGIPLLFRLFNINFLLSIVQNNLLQISYFTIFLASLFWFAYHIILLNVDLKQAKEKLALFTAIATTITTIMSNILLGDLKVIFVYILLSYTWIRYLIESKTNATSG